MLQAYIVNDTEVFFNIFFNMYVFQHEEPVSDPDL